MGISRRYKTQKIKDLQFILEIQKFSSICRDFVYKNQMLNKKTVHNLMVYSKIVFKISFETLIIIKVRFNYFIYYHVSVGKNFDLSNINKLAN